MRDRRVVMLLLVVVSLIAVWAFTGCKTEETSGGSGQYPMMYSARLSGVEVAPQKVTTRASGMATFKVAPNGREVTFTLTVRNLKDITAAHIHIGARGKNGGVIVPLYDGAKHGVFSGVLAEGTIKRANLVGPLKGKPLSALADLVAEGKAYVNVHTIRYPDGELRGQIRSEQHDQYHGGGGPDGHQQHPYGGAPGGY